MAAGRALAANVYVDGVLYPAGSVPPGKVARAITNPKAWVPAESSQDEADHSEATADEAAEETPAESSQDEADN